MRKHRTERASYYKANGRFFKPNLQADGVLSPMRFAVEACARNGRGQRAEWRCALLPSKRVRGMVGAQRAEWRSLLPSKRVRGMVGAQRAEWRCAFLPSKHVRGMVGAQRAEWRSLLPSKRVRGMVGAQRAEWRCASCRRSVCEEWLGLSAPRVGGLHFGRFRAIKIADRRKSCTIMRCFSWRFAFQGH